MSAIYRTPGLDENASGLPRFFRAPTLREGSTFRYDFRDAFTRDGHANAALAFGDTFLDLMWGGGSAVYASGGVGAAGTWSLGAGGLVTAGGNLNVLDLGAGYNLAADDDRFIVIAEIVIPSVGHVATANRTIIDLSTDGSGGNAQFRIDTGAAGIAPRALVAFADGSNSAAMGGAITLDVPQQVGVAWEPGKASLYINGLLTAEGIFAELATLRDVGAAHVKLHGEWAGTLRMVMQENLTASGRSAAQVAAEEWAMMA